MTDPRWTYRWKQLRRSMIASATHCALCGYLLDRDAPARSRWRPSIDHIVSLAEGGEPYDPANLRVVCGGCNSSRGASMGNLARGTRHHPAPLPTWHSRVW